MSGVGKAGLEATLRLLSIYEGFPLNIEERESSIKLTPTEPDTFAVTLYDHGSDTMIAAERWHTHYEDPSQVAWCAMWLLSPFYRLVQETKGGVLVATWIERWESSGWEGFEPVYFLNPEHAESWLPGRGETIGRRYWQQAVLPPPKPYTDFEPKAALDEDGLPADSFIGIRTITVDKALGPTLF